jgi:hypothetical protein
MAWIGPVVQGVTGLAQTIAASAAAKKLPDAQKYEATPQMKRAEEMALRRAEQGMSAAERAAFEQGMARRTGAAERAMRNIGLAGVAQGVSNIFNIDAMNQFAAQSEAERRRGEQMYAGIAGQMQSIQDSETTSFNQMLQQQRTALGQAAASGMKNITGAAGMASQMIHTENLAKKYGYQGYGKFYKPDEEESTPPLPATTTPSTTTPGIDLSVINTATAPGVGLDGTLEGSGVPFLPSDGSLDYRVMDSSDAFYSDTEPRFDSKTSPFGSDVSSEKAFQDYANAQAGYDITKGYGWGPASSAAYGIYGQQFRNR